ncbi:suppressor of tumorigenicity 14 protein-like protein [Pitangus sulphuratus]|nr:suppressor of tumorigenicity 14 protein-like protein [Pitangus sulphuratus]
MQMQGRARFVSAVRRIIVHEYYNSRNYDYDIALLQLSKPWPDAMSHVIQPVCVPPFSHKVRSGDKCWITGWGQKQETAPAFSFIYIGGSLEIPNLTYTNDLNDPTSQKFLLQAEAIQNYLAETYESSFLGKYYLKSVVAAFSEGEFGLRAYYWNTFWAPQDIVASLKQLTPVEQKEMCNKQAAHLFSSSGEEDFDLVSMELFVSFDLYAKPGNNRTLTLMNPKKSFYQWRLRVPSNCVVRLVVINLHGVTPESCASHHLSAYDFLLPLQNKIITRWCGPGAWTPSVVRLTSSRNVMLLTFSLDQREGSSILKAHFQAVPKIMCGGHYISWNGTLSSPYYPSYYPPNIDCSWIIKAPLPGYKLSLKILVIQIQEKSPGSSKCDKDWLEIDGVRYCKALSENNRNREYGYSVAINFHSDELVTHRGFYIEYKAFSHTDRCNPERLNCGDRKCKHQYRSCKDDDSCGKESDENNCSYKSCSPYAYKCLNGKCLLKPNPECDGKRDCADGSDEMNCGVLVGDTRLRKTELLEVKMQDLESGLGKQVYRWEHKVTYSVPLGWRAYMGLHTINGKSNHVAMRSIKRIIVHPQYDQSISDYDIALLEMEMPVFFNELVQPICLPSTSRVFLYGTVCYVTGWGAIKENSHFAKTLQEARVRIINQDVCNKLYDDLITSRMLCAGNLNGGVDACQCWAPYLGFCQTYSIRQCCRRVMPFTVSGNYINEAGLQPVYLEPAEKGFSSEDVPGKIDDYSASSSVLRILRIKRDRGARTETEEMKRQNSAQEHEIIELREDNVEESEADHNKPLNAQTRKLTEVYSSSPALGRYFRTAQVISFSNESSTVIYQLVFSVPPSTEGFMENLMNPDFIRNILRQNIYDEDNTFDPGTSECDGLKLDRTSLTEMMEEFLIFITTWKR